MPNENDMRIHKLRKRLRPDRPMIMISLRIPADVIEDLKRVAPMLGFSGYQPLIRAYIGQGLRKDMERLEREQLLTTFVESLRKRGVSEDIISDAMDETQAMTQPFATTESIA